MTGGEIAVNPAQLASDIKRMRETASVLRSRLQELYRYMEELDTMWEGAANHAFHMQFGMDREQMGRLCRTLDGMIDCYDHAQREYGNCEREVFAIEEDISV